MTRLQKRRLCKARQHKMARFLNGQLKKWHPEVYATLPKSTNWRLV